MLVFIAFVAELTTGIKGKGLLQVEMKVYYDSRAKKKCVQLLKGKGKGHWTGYVPTGSELSMFSVSLSGSMVPSGLKTISRILASFALTVVFVAIFGGMLCICRWLGVGGCWFLGDVDGLGLQM